MPRVITGPATMHARLLVLLLALLAALLPSGAAAAPRIWTVSPRVVQRGTTAEIVIDRWYHEARELLFYGPGLRCTASSLDADKHLLTCTLHIDPDCPLGEQAFRIRTDESLSDIGTIHVGPFPIVDEEEANHNTNDTEATARAVEANTTVRGILSRSGTEDVDCYRVVGRAGERLSVEVDMVRIAGYPENDPQLDQYDAVVAILDPAGRVIAESDDSPLHRQDPLVSVRLPTDGGYIVVVRRSSFFPLDSPYAVHLGTFSRPLAAYPAGGPAGVPVAVTLLGDPLGPARQTIVVAETPGTFAWFGDAPSPLSLRSSPFPNVLEAADQPETAVAEIPAAINGILSQAGETDRFRLTVKKGLPLQLRVWSAALGLPVDPVIRLRPVDASGAAGSVELEADDAKLEDRDIFGGTGDFPDIFDPSVVWTPKQDGDYLLEVADTRGFGGPTNVYRVDIAPPIDTLHIALVSTGHYKIERPRATSLAVPRGNRWTVNLSLFPGQGTTFKGPFELAVEGLPAGMRMISPTVPVGQTSWPMLLEARDDATPAAAVIYVTAKAAAAARPLSVVNQQNIPRVNYSGGSWRSIRLDRFATAVTEPAPFAVELELPRMPLPKGAEMTLPVRVTRRTGFDEPLEMQCMFGPSGVTLPPAVEIPAGKSEVLLLLSAAASAKVGSGPLSVLVSTSQPRPGAASGEDNYRGTERIRVSSPLVDLTVAEPFVTLSAKPQSIRRGERREYRWAVKQLQPFAGRATLRLVGLPVGVTAAEPAPTIDAKSSEITFNLEATDDALLGEVSGLTCELAFAIEGEHIRLKTGSGKLRIDPRLEK
jgi:hypothetical protein